MPLQLGYIHIDSVSHTTPIRLNDVRNAIPADDQVALLATESEKREQALSFATMESSLMSTVKNSLIAAREIQSSCGVEEREIYEER